MTSPRWDDRLAERLLALMPWLVLAYILLTFRQHGPSNDELVQHRYGELLWDFYLSGFQDRAAFSYINLYFYGGLFDMIAVPLARLLPPAALWDLRHLLSALFGLLGMIAAGRIARDRAGPLAALFAWAILCLMGMWSGAMFTHTKDVPFATCMVWALLYLMRLLAAAEKGEAISWRDALLFGAWTGLALGLRVGAVLIGVYALAGLAMILLHQGKAAWPRIAALLARCAVAAVVALILMALFWPWSVQGWTNVLDTLRHFADYEFELQTAFAGQTYAMAELPRLYLPIYVLVKLPELALAGLSAAAILAMARRRLPDAAGASLALAALFPIAYAVLQNPPLYNGMRHFLFVAPPLAVLAGVGLAEAWAWSAGQTRLRPLRAPLLAGLLALGLVPLALMQPYGYAGYNALLGWLPGAAKGWESDYWSDALLPMAKALANEPQVKQATPGSIPVAVCAEAFQVAHLLPPAFRITKAWPAAEYFLSTTHMGCDKALDGPVIAQIKRMGVPLAVLKERRTKGRAWQKAHPGVR